jgi:hypothetical protein
MFNFSGIISKPGTKHSGQSSTTDYTKGLPDNDIVATKKTDELTGAANYSNTFEYSKNSFSLLKSYDTITNYATTDAIDSPFVKSGQIAIDLDTICENISSLSAKSIAKQCLTKETFKAGNAGAFTASGYNGTFVVLNDNRDGFQAGTDAVIFLAGYQLSSTTSVNVV